MNRERLGEKRCPYIEVVYLGLPEQEVAFRCTLQTFDECPFVEPNLYKICIVYQTKGVIRSREPSAEKSHKRK